MKARDVAALAALGLAGKLAYDKFGGKKDDEPKTRGKLGKSQSANDGDAGESEARMSKRDMNEGSGRRDAGGNTEDVDRRAGVPERMGQDAAGSLFTDRDVAEAPVAVASPVPTPEIQARPLGSTGGPSRYSPAADSNAAGSADGAAPANLGTFSTSNASYDATAPVAQRLSAIESANGAGTPSALATNAYANVSRTNQNLSNTKKAALAAPLIAKSSALANVSHADQAAYMARNRAREAAAKMDEIAKLDELNKSNFVGGRRAKGGVVKMASGGLASSKMSKPSGASRGDGIAQRGRTRGKYL